MVRLKRQTVDVCIQLLGCVNAKNAKGQDVKAEVGLEIGSHLLPHHLGQPLCADRRDRDAPRPREVSRDVLLESVDLAARSPDHASNAKVGAGLKDIVKPGDIVQVGFRAGRHPPVWPRSHVKRWLRA